MLAGGRILLHGQIRILHRTFDAVVVTGSEDVSEAKVFSRNAPFVVKRSLKGRDNAPAAPEILSKLIALLVRKRRNVRQNQNFESIDVRGIEQAVVHHFERNSAFDKGVVETKRVVFHFRSGMLAAVERRGLL